MADFLPPPTLIESLSQHAEVAGSDQMAVIPTDDLRRAVRAIDDLRGALAQLLDDKEVTYAVRVTRARNALREHG